MTSNQIIVLATPVFFFFMALEFAWGWRQARKGSGRNTYRLNDAINSVALGILSQLSAVFTSLLRVGIYTAIFSSVALFPDTAFWSTWYGWLLALVFYDFCYYWLHRGGHGISLLWAAHAVHHQSQNYNLSTGLRQTSSGSLLSWIFFVPMAVAGVPPVVFAVVALVDLLYQFWVHTEQVPKLGWFDRWFCSPSNHRVHHAVNDPYLDRNYGGILIIWDRLFGTFKEEEERCVYGTRSLLNSWDPLWANAQVYHGLWLKSLATPRWSDKLRYWLKPPGWRPQNAEPVPVGVVYDVSSVPVFHPPMSPGVMWFAGLQFMALLLGAGGFLWVADGLPLTQSALWFAAISACLWAVGAVTQGRINMLEVLLIEAAALATASSGTPGMLDLHVLLKPLPLILAMIFIAYRARIDWSKGLFYPLLLLALGCALTGDVLLLMPDRFLSGVAAFLLAHLAYLALFKQNLPWFPSRRALAATLLLGVVVYAVVWNGVPPELRLPIGLYVIAIALMAAQAIGRALVLQSSAATGVAIGACFFMLSDSLLAIDRFAVALPAASVWVLASYYAAQILIVHHAQPAAAAESCAGQEGASFS